MKKSLLIKIIFPLSLLVSTGYSQQFMPDSNTIGLWHFNENQGSIAYDSSGNLLHGELQNGTSWDSLGMFESCVKFSANYQRVRVEDTPILDIANNLTLDAWINLDSINNGGLIISKWRTNTSIPKGQYSFGISSTNKIYLYLGDDTSQYYLNSDSIIVQFNEWTFVSAVFSNGLAGLFINGAQVSSSEVPFDSLTTLEYLHDDLFIGDLWTDAYYPYSFDGKIDEVRISNIARYQVVLGINDNEINNILKTPILHQNYPNPFNPVTKINFEISKSSFIELVIYDILGKEVAALVKNNVAAGRHEAIWNASDFSNGIYFYQLTAGKFSEVKKMILMK